MTKAARVCSVPGCPNLTTAGRCEQHVKAADRARGTARQRGYDKGHERFRRAVLRRDRECVLCHEPAVVADHYPLSRRELVDQGLNPNDPANGRGLCSACHYTATAHNQPGGFGAR